ncbi:MAG: chaperonin GroEL, partial [Clostridia bacterium]|nr:chaperonin GroEL [Clostridia bacterium]
GDEKTGAEIVIKAVEAPLRQIATNAGLDGSVILNRVVTSKRENFGFNFLTNEYTDMVSSGIIDPTKVSRSALQNSASIASTLLTTESLITDIPQPETPMANPNMGGMY